MKTTTQRVGERKGNLALNILTEKCPHCGESKVFKKMKNPFIFPEMKDNCDVCNYRFDREPGYFLGAMYLSYAMAVFLGILTFLTCYFFFPGMETIWIPTLIFVVITAFSYKIYKVSRIIYIHIFPW
jgi:uncharacterized protein (DUF983 family)